VSHEPARLAAELTATTQALRESIDAWTHDGDPSSGPPPEAVVLQALYQQRMYGAIVADARLAGRAVALLPAWLAGQARATIEAGSRLRSLVGHAGTPTRLKTGPPEPAGRLLGYYQEAQRRFDIDWEVLAALNFLESRFGRVRNSSSAGAQGPMQFIPSTWAAYGLGGDINDPHAAILGAANYLKAAGAPGYYRHALYSYNHSQGYVDAVLLYAHQMMGDPRVFYEYYNWQVFELTPSGPRRLTGPGL